MENHRSINSEAIACLSAVVIAQPVDPDALLASARTLRILRAVLDVAQSPSTYAPP